MKIRVFGIGILFNAMLLCGGTLSANPTTWTNQSGVKLEAEFLGFEGEKVILKRTRDGRIFKVEKNVFIEEDQEKMKLLAIQIADKAKPEKPSVNDDKGGAKPGSQKTLNFDDPWPKLISVNRDYAIKPVEGKEGQFVYHSKHFEFISDVRLSNSAVKRFGEIFEATLLYCQALPISSQKAINHTEGKRKQIFLYANRDDYHKAGGMPKSAGVYISGREVILVAMESLGLKKMGSGFTLDRKDDNKTLPHEITHMFTDRQYFSPGARGWFSEGLAEYVAATPYRGGKFMVNSNRKAIVEYVTKFGKDGKGGRNLGVDIRVGPLKNFMLMGYSNFTANGNFNYGVGTLLVYHFFHFEDNGRERINAFLKALQAGKTGEAALTELLGDRTFEEMEKDIQSEWRSRGIKLTFSSK